VDEKVREKILWENIKLGKIEHKIYRQIHTEIYNFYEQRRIQKEVDFILRLFSNKKDLTCLDVGCGTGNLTLKFLERGFTVTGVDISRDMLNILKSYIIDLKFNAKKVTLITSDADNFIENSVRDNKKYDVVSFSSILHHLPDYLNTIKNACNLVHLGGCIYITHEPPLTAGVERSILCRILAFADGMAYGLILRMKNVKHPDISCYRYADYHVWQEKGVDQQKILHILRENGFRIIHFKKYIIRQNGIFALVCNALKICSPNGFCPIAQKIGDR